MYYIILYKETRISEAIETLPASTRMKEKVMYTFTQVGDWAALKAVNFLEDDLTMVVRLRLTDGLSKTKQRIERPLRQGEREYLCHGSPPPSACIDSLLDGGAT